MNFPHFFGKNTAPASATAADPTNESPPPKRKLSEMDSQSSNFCMFTLAELKRLEAKKTSVEPLLENRVLNPVDYNYRKVIGKKSAHEHVLDFAAQNPELLNKVGPDYEFVGSETYETLIVYFLDLFEVLEELKSKWRDSSELSFRMVYPKFVDGKVIDLLEKPSRLDYIYTFAEKLAAADGNCAAASDIDKISLIDKTFLVKFFIYVFELAALYVFMVRGLYNRNQISETGLAFHEWRMGKEASVEYSALGESAFESLESLVPFETSAENMHFWAVRLINGINKINH